MGENIYTNKEMLGWLGYFADKMETSDDFRTGGELEKGRINCCLSHEDAARSQ